MGKKMLHVHAKVAWIHSCVKHIKHRGLNLVDPKVPMHDLLIK